MGIVTIEELSARLKRDGRLVGLDVGDKTVGVAVSDVMRTVASPLVTIKRTKFTADAEKLRKIVDEQEAAALVIGLPVNMDGTEGPRCQSVRQFAANLLTRIDITIVFWDERLSTAAVTRAMIDADMSRRRRAEIVDKAAAAYILEGALDRLAVLARAAGGTGDADRC